MDAEDEHGLPGQRNAWMRKYVVVQILHRLHLTWDWTWLTINAA